MNGWSLGKTHMKIMIGMYIGYFIISLGYGIIGTI